MLSLCMFYFKITRNDDSGIEYEDFIETEDDLIHPQDRLDDFSLPCDIDFPSFNYPDYTKVGFWIKIPIDDISKYKD